MNEYFWQGFPRAGRAAPRDFFQALTREIPPSSPASPWKTPSAPPLLIWLTQSGLAQWVCYYSRRSLMILLATNKSPNKTVWCLPQRFPKLYFLAFFHHHVCFFNFCDLIWVLTFLHIWMFFCCCNFPENYVWDLNSIFLETSKK